MIASFNRGECCSEGQQRESQVTSGWHSLVLCVLCVLGFRFLGIPTLRHIHQVPRTLTLTLLTAPDRGKSPNTYEVYHTQNEPTGEVTEWSHGRPGTVLVAFLLSSDSPYEPCLTKQCDTTVTAKWMTSKMGCGLMGRCATSCTTD